LIVRGDRPCLLDLRKVLSNVSSDAPLVFLLVIAEFKGFVVLCANSKVSLSRLSPFPFYFLYFVNHALIHKGSRALGIGIARIALDLDIPHILLSSHTSRASTGQ
jgi:hypothetical protein